MVTGKALSVLGSGFMVNPRVLAAALLLLAFTGCTNIAEHDMAVSAGLHIISSEDFSTINTISGITSARSLLICPGNLFVVSTNGVIYRYNSETFELISEHQIAAPSPSGFTQIVYSSLKNSAYLIGPIGIILEISIPDCTVLDEFSVCQAPVELALGLGSQKLFVADGPSNAVHMISTYDNTLDDSADMYFNITCMAPCENPDSMLVGTTGSAFLVEVTGPVSMRSTVRKAAENCHALAQVPGDTVFVGILGSSIGRLDVFFDEFQWPLPPVFYGTAGISGTSHVMAMGIDWHHVYVLSYAGDSMSRLISYNYCTKIVTQELDIPGMPMDLKVSGDGVIYALTAN